VIEDIDCLSDVVLDRDFKNKNFDERLIDIEKELQWIRKSKSKSTVAKEKVKQLFEEKKSIMVLKNPDKSKHVELVDERINLSFLLNLFDGVLETPGRILIVSSNYPERIDKALIRPGRIDLNIRFGFCSSDTVKEIVSKVYEIAIEDLDKYEFADNEYTPAEINQVLFNYIENKKKGIEQLLKENIKEKKQEEEPHDEVTTFLESTDSLDSLSSGIDESEFRSLLDYQEEEIKKESKDEEKVQKKKKKTKIIEKLLEAVDESSDEESE
jgi:SpoVK/Ycf46/Vps4 family AAA+-type ATPase